MLEFWECGHYSANSSAFLSCDGGADAISMPVPLNAIYEGAIPPLTITVMYGTARCICGMSNLALPHPCFLVFATTPRVK